MQAFQQTWFKLAAVAEEDHLADGRHLLFLHPPTRCRLRCERTSHTHSVLLRVRVVQQGAY